MENDVSSAENGVRNIILGSSEGVGGMKNDVPGAGKCVRNIILERSEGLEGLINDVSSGLKDWEEYQFGGVRKVGVKNMSR